MQIVKTIVFSEKKITDEILVIQWKTMNCKQIASVL